MSGCCHPRKLLPFHTGSAVASNANGRSILLNIWCSTCNMKNGYCSVINLQGRQRVEGEAIPNGSGGGEAVLLVHLRRGATIPQPRPLKPRTSDWQRRLGDCSARGCVDSMAGAFFHSVLFDGGFSL
jgi:hypothetical protein